MKRLIAAVAILALTIPSVALAAGSLKLSPPSVAPGQVLKMSGKGCKTGKTVYLRSGAFKGTSSGGQGFGFVKTTAKAGGTFSAKTTIPQTRTAGTYAVYASCQTSGHFAVERLTVT